MKNVPLWMKAAVLEFGQQEVSGSRHNPRILEYHRETSLGASDDETPWCASFVNWSLKKGGVTGTNSAMARSFLKWGIPIEKPIYGCVVVFERGDYPKGHVAFFVGDGGFQLERFVNVLGGNQSNKVSVASYKKSSVIGYRWPATARAQV